MRPRRRATDSRATVTSLFPATWPIRLQSIVSGPMLRRLRTLSELECYTRCYGSGDAKVRIVRILPRQPVPAFEHVSLGRVELVEACGEQRLDRRGNRDALTVL